MVFFSYLPEAGEYQCLMLYLENTVRFTKADLALFIAVLGTLSIIAQTSVQRISRKKKKRKRKKKNKKKKKKKEEEEEEEDE